MAVQKSGTLIMFSHVVVRKIIVLISFIVITTNSLPTNGLVTRNRDFVGLGTYPHTDDAIRVVIMQRQLTVPETIISDSPSALPIYSVPYHCKVTNSLSKSPTDITSNHYVLLTIPHDQSVTLD